MYFLIRYAGMLELADRMVSKTIVRNGVWVQVPLPAPLLKNLLSNDLC